MNETKTHKSIQIITMLRDNIYLARTDHKVRSASLFTDAFLIFASMALFSMHVIGVGRSILLQILFMGGAALLVLVLFFNATKRYHSVQVYGPLLVTGLLILLCLAFRSQFATGLNACIDRLSLLLSGRYERIYQRFYVADIAETGLVFFLLIWTIALAAICFFLARQEYRGVVLIPVIIYGILIGTGLVPLDRAIVISVLLLLTAIMMHFWRNTHQAQTWQTMTLLTLIGIVVIGSAIFLSYATGIYQKLGSGNLYRVVSKAYHHHKYESVDAVLPEGDFRDLGEFDPTKRDMLTVVMTKPEKTYLRGYVGEKYNGHGWENLRGDSVADANNDFYWLHRNGIYGQSLPAAGYASLEDSENGTMTILYQNACRYYIYTPYGLDQTEGALADPALIGDATIYNLKREIPSSYEISYRPQAVKDSYILQEELSDPKISDKASYYLSRENTYRDFAYANYLDLPEDTKKTIEAILGEQADLSTTEAKSLILSYLNDEMTYDPESKDQAENEDFVTYFLRESKTGYSVHYATTAALMMRYFGIPARYVEGYRITEDKIEKEEGETLAHVTEEDAHAWAEYYLDGVGWMPFEVTPGYQDAGMYARSDNTTDDEDHASNNTTGETPDDSEEEESDAKDTDDEIENPMNNYTEIFTFRWLYLLALLVLVILAILIRTIVRRYQLNRFRESFADEDPKRGSGNALAYAVFLLKRKIPTLDTSHLKDGVSSVRETYGDEIGDAFAGCLLINDRIRYSDREIDSDDRTAVMKFQELVLECFKNERSLLQKVWDYLGACIY